MTCHCSDHLIHRLGQNGCHFADHIFKHIFINENFCILILISLKFVPNGPIENKPALLLVMAWHRIGDKPLPEAMLTQFTDAYICSTSRRWFWGWGQHIRETYVNTIAADALAPSIARSSAATVLIACKTNGTVASPRKDFNYQYLHHLGIENSWKLPIRHDTVCILSVKSL